MTHEDHDTLDEVLGQDMEQATNYTWWRAIAIGGMGTAMLCGTLAVVGWIMRPDVQAFVQLVHVTSDGQVEDRGTVAMAHYTPADWQWIGMLRQWVLALRWRGLDVRHAHLAWDWLKWHSCGEAVEQLQRYFTVEEPFEHIGVRKREVLNIMVTKGDIDGLWTVLWKEVAVHGAQPPVERQQSVSFAVARRKVTAEMHQQNGFGLCVKKFGGLQL